MRYLITQSLLSSWGYMFDSMGSMDEAKEKFMLTLNREKTERTEAMQNGIDFEREVYAEAAGTSRTPHPKWESGIREVAGIIQGAPVQVKAKRDLEVSGMNFLVYGILDALKAGVIYDVKFTSKNLASDSVYIPGKYLNSPQHPAYFYIVPEAQEFRYLVSDGKAVYIETYRRGECPFIGDIISEFIASITDMGLLDIYKEKWAAK